MAWASTVAVVVPSPAMSEVLLATSFTIWAPMFSNLFSSSISLATVTPSLVIVGEPKLFSMTTLRPLGPRVTLTASARTFTPRRIASRATWSKMICLAAMFVSLLVGKGWLLLEHAEDVVLAHDQRLLAVDLDLGPGVLGEQHAVAGLHVERVDLAVLAELALADGDHLALDRLLLRRVGDDDAALRLLLLLDALDDDAVLKRTNLHVPASWLN